MAQAPSKSERKEIRKEIGNRVIAGPDSGVRSRGPDYLVAHACFECRKSWKRSEESGATCPECGGSLHWMGRAFKAPKKSNLEQWEKVEALWGAGFRFIAHTRWRKVEPYPERLREVTAFIENNREHPFRVKD
jgi:ssDNA-binding Zn-finger/Zn-ribbon topoisomerase 1